METGTIIKCTALALLSGTTDAFTKANLATTENKVMVYLLGQTVVSTKEDGSLESSTDKVFSQLQRASRKKESGLMAKSHAGSMKAVIALQTTRTTQSVTTEKH